jgi:hypothetical protein
MPGQASLALSCSQIISFASVTELKMAAMADIKHVGAA